MTEESGVDQGASTDGTIDDGASDSEVNASLDDLVGEVLRDVEAAYEDYERGYVDADATLSVVMKHVSRLQEPRDEA
jgi:hypothetical protein